jgi:flagellar biosynthesis/type III secretory pathway chaperone
MQQSTLKKIDKVIKRRQQELSSRIAECKEYQQQAEAEIMLLNRGLEQARQDAAKQPEFAITLPAFEKKYMLKIQKLRERIAQLTNIIAQLEQSLLQEYMEQRKYEKFAERLRIEELKAADQQEAKELDELSLQNYARKQQQAKMVEGAQPTTSTDS